jgi:hypothetical protein
MTQVRCPVCLYDGLRAEPTDFRICPSCGTEFGYHDAVRSHRQLRDEWLARGPEWHSAVVTRPAGWDGIAQISAGLDRTLASDSAVSGDSVEIFTFRLGANADLRSGDTPAFEPVLSGAGG